MAGVVRPSPQPTAPCWLSQRLPSLSKGAVGSICISNSCSAAIEDCNSYLLIEV